MWNISWTYHTQKENDPKKQSHFEWQITERTDLPLCSLAALVVDGTDDIGAVTVCKLEGAMTTLVSVICSSGVLCITTVSGFTPAACARASAIRRRARSRSCRCRSSSWEIHSQIIINNRSQISINPSIIMLIITVKHASMRHGRPRFSLVALNYTCQRQNFDYSCSQYFQHSIKFNYIFKCEFSN